MTLFMITSSESRAPDKARIFISIMPISSQKTMFDHLLESSYRDDFNKMSNIGFHEKITQVEPIEFNLTLFIWSSGFLCLGLPP